MANTFTQLTYHVVFSTKNRTPVLMDAGREELYRYFWGIHKSLGCHLYRIGGVEDHVHILTSMPTTLAMSKYLQEIKTGTSAWIKSTRKFPGWEGWQDGYGAFTVSASHRNAVIEYIRNQPEHHRTESFLDELRRLLVEAGVKFDERYLV